MAQRRTFPAAEVIEPPQSPIAASLPSGNGSLGTPLPNGVAFGWLADLLRIGRVKLGPPHVRYAQANGKNGLALGGSVARDVGDLLELGFIRSLRTPTGPGSQAGCTYALTAAGAAAVRRWIAGLEALLRDAGRAGVLQPRWNHLQQELWLGDLMVKRFRRPAPNQELVLDAFETQHWPERIDDPLLRSIDVEPKVRLHETIKSLNEACASLIHFGGDGTGLGVRWCLQVEQLQHTM